MVCRAQARVVLRATPIKRPETPPPPVTVDGTTFTNYINAAYVEAIHWQTNIFKLPFEKEGKAFVNELVRLFHAYAESSSMEIIAFMHLRGLCQREK